MMNYKFPVKNPQPDIEHFLRVLKGEVTSGRIPVCDYTVDDAIMRPVLTGMLGREWVDVPEKETFTGCSEEMTKEALERTYAWLDNRMAFWYHMGYDYFCALFRLPLPAADDVTNDTAVGNEGKNRVWQKLDHGVIQSWEDFEKYPWPKVTDKMFYMHEYICEHLPEGMGFATSHALGVYEHLSRLMGYEGLCINLYDQPDLVKAVADKLGELISEYYRHLMEFKELRFTWQGDDLGYNTQTLISPDDIRSLILPWHKKFAQQVHDAGKLYVMHSCGKIDTIMDDLINDVKIDAKHSFQDGVMEFRDSKKQWGDKIALMGGIDMNVLCNYDEENLRKYVREMIEDCRAGGRIAVGSGNSVTSYVPLNNYLAMVDEIHRC